MATEMDKQNLIQNTFRRSSLSTPGGPLMIEAHKIPDIFGQMGQAFNMDKVHEHIAKLDKDKTGLLTHDQWNELCKKFVTDPATLVRLGGSEFLEKTLIRPGDFATP